MRLFSNDQTYTNGHSQRGFTLVEMMIVVAIMTILVLIAYPKYQDYDIKTKRSDMMIELQNIANRIHTQKLLQGSYDVGIPLTSIYSHTLSSSGLTTYPNSGTALYTLSINRLNDDNTAITHPEWTITATPIAGLRMRDDGDLSISHDGKKCHYITPLKCSFGDGWQ